MIRPLESVIWRVRGALVIRIRKFPTWTSSGALPVRSRAEGVSKSCTSDPFCGTGPALPSTIGTIVSRNVCGLIVANRTALPFGPARTLLVPPGASRRPKPSPSPSKPAVALDSHLHPLVREDYHLTLNDLKRLFNESVGYQGIPRGRFQCRALGWCVAIALLALSNT